MFPGCSLERGKRCGGSGVRWALPTQTKCFGEILGGGGGGRGGGIQAYHNNTHKTQKQSKMAVTREIKVNTPTSSPHPHPLFFYTSWQSLQGVSVTPHLFLLGWVRICNGYVRAAVVIRGFRVMKVVRVLRIMSVLGVVWVNSVS